MGNILHILKIPLSLRFIILGLAFAAGGGCSKPEPASFELPVEIKVQASLTFKDGDTKPVASTHFYVLKSSLYILCGDAGMERFGWVKDGSLLQTSKFAMNVLNDRTAPGHAELLAAVKKSKRGEFDTDMNGTASLSVAPMNTFRGTGYFVGSTEMRGQRVFWDHGVEFKDGVNQVHLNAKNARIE